MKHSTGKPTKAQAARLDALSRSRCLACRKMGFYFEVCGKTEVHHLNLGGRAGQKRRGHDFTIPLGTWHHKGVVHLGWSERDMEAFYGPSLARASKRFREQFGTDDQLLDETNRLLASMNNPTPARILGK